MFTRGRGFLVPRSNKVPVIVTRRTGSGCDVAVASVTGANVDVGALIVAEEIGVDVVDGELSVADDIGVTDRLVPIAVDTEVCVTGAVTVDMVTGSSSAETE